MSIDGRVRAGLIANTAALTPDVEDRLASLGHRVRRRRRIRFASWAAVAVSAGTAAVLWVPGAVQSIQHSPVPSQHTPRPVPSPTSLATLRPGVALAPGTYSTTFVGSRRTALLPTAVVRVPSGYVVGAPGDVDSANDPTAPGFRHLSLWTVAEVVSGPCAAAPRWVDPGPTAQDLAGALAALPVWQSTTPEPVTIGGFDGLVMDFDVPDTVPARCGDTLLHWRDDLGDSQGIASGKHQRLWILDVAGERVVILAGWFPREGSHSSDGATPAQVDELVRMAEGITFVAPAGRS